MVFRIDEQNTMIPPVFVSRKNKILAELSAPEEEYSDLSPKGSVDEGIRDLIEDINTLPGLVTTSSCAGRISVFLEGRKAPNLSEESPSAGDGRKFVPSGGKGAGRWLYVSHDPLEIKENQSLLKLFEMVPGDGKPPGVDKGGHALRLVRFHFEPMVNLTLPIQPPLFCIESPAINLSVVSCLCISSLSKQKHHLLQCHANMTCRSST